MIIALKKMIKQIVQKSVLNKDGYHQKKYRSNAH